MLCSKSMLASARVHRLNESSFSLSQVATFFFKLSKLVLRLGFFEPRKKNLKHGRTQEGEVLQLGLSSARGVTAPFEKVGVDDSTLALLEDGAAETWTVRGWNYFFTQLQFPAVCHLSRLRNLCFCLCSTRCLAMVVQRLLSDFGRPRRPKTAPLASDDAAQLHERRAGELKRLQSRPARSSGPVWPNITFTCS